MDGKKKVERPHWLPDFCSLPVLFALMLVAELVVLVIVLAPDEQLRPSLPRLGTTTVFVQWLALMMAVCLCKLRPYLLRLRTAVAVLLAYALMVLLTTLASELVFALDQSLGTELTLPPEFQSRFVLGNAVTCALISAALLRYFYVLEQWRERVRAAAKAQFDALQARIRPHFLFNSMNTIASLIRTRPQEAERAVEDLADLFRAALGSADQLTTLGEELDMVRRYLSIEQLRLGERLRLDWRVDALPRELPLPALLLQPLVENAVYHGIQALSEGGTVTVSGELRDGAAVLTIANPCPLPADRRSSGHGMALSNTRSRIEYHFGNRAALDVVSGADSFVCTVSLPYESSDR